MTEANTTTTPAAKEAQLPAADGSLPKHAAPTITLRPLTRNEVTFTPTWEPVQRGLNVGLYYPAVLPTEENFSEWTKFVGVKNIIEALAAKARLDAKATTDAVVDKGNLWIEAEKKDAAGHTVMSKTDKDGEGNFLPELSRIYYTYESLPLEEILGLLERGSIRGGVTITSLQEEIDTLHTELRGLVNTAMTAKTEDERNAALASAMEKGTKVQNNEEEIKRIQAARTPRVRASSAATTA